MPAAYLLAEPAGDRKRVCDHEHDRLHMAAGPRSTNRGHDTERRDEPMMPTITALVTSRGAHRA